MLSLVPIVLPDGRTLLVGGCRDGAVVRWDAETGVLRWDAETGGRVGEPISCDGEVATMTACGDADGRLVIATGSRDEVGIAVRRVTR